MVDHAHSPYLEDIPLDEALARWWQALAEGGLDSPFAGEPVPLDEAAGPRYGRAGLGAGLVAALSCGGDGWLCRARRGHAGCRRSPARFTWPLGQQAFYVDTGDPLPPNTNAVIMVEDVQLRPAGAAASTGEAGHRDRGRRSALAARTADGRRHGGHRARLARQPPPASAGYRRGRRGRPRRPRAVAGSPGLPSNPTGTELVVPGSNLRPGDVVEYNSLVWRPWSAEWGGHADRLPPWPTITPPSALGCEQPASHPRPGADQRRLFGRQSEDLPPASWPSLAASWCTASPSVPAIR